jgi:hypothetical protein
MSPSTPPRRLDDWQTINTLAAELNRSAPVLSTHALRKYVQQAEHNGLSPHVRRLGRKILISGSGFAEWLDQRPSTPPPRGR